MHTALLFCVWLLNVNHYLSNTIKNLADDKKGRLFKSHDYIKSLDKIHIEAQQILIQDNIKDAQGMLAFYF